MTQPIDWTTKPAIQTQPYHHFCSVLERGDIEEKMHSSAIDIYDGGIKLDGRKNRARLVEVIALGHGRWVQGGRQPREVEKGSLVYVKERTIPFRLHLRKQNHFFVPMDAIMAELDHVNLKLRPVGQHIITRELDQFIDDRVRKAVTGGSTILMGQTVGVDKDGQEADDIGCNKTRIEEVVAVGPGEFGGWKQELKKKPDGDYEMVNIPYWRTPDAKAGDLIVFTDMARPTRIVLAGKSYTLFEFDHSVCAILDQAV